MALALDFIKVKLNLEKLTNFLIGFVIGFLFVFIIFEQRELPRLKAQFGQTTHLYNDIFSNKLYNEVKVLCMIMTNPANHKTKAIHVRNTWGKRCNKLLFITSQDDPDLDTIVLPVKESRKALRNKTKGSFLFAHDQYLNEFDWFMKADDDK